MKGYLIFLVSFAVAGGVAWLARDLIFGKPPAEDRDREGADDDLVR